MSIIEDMGARIRAASDDLPVAQVLKALDHLQGASERLRWVRQESVSPMGVPELSAAIEHAETAGHALRVAQEQLAAYLTAIGLGNDPAPPAPPTAEAQRRRAGTDPGPQPPPIGAPATSDPVRRWWPSRVAELTGRKDDPTKEREHRVGDADELLRRVATAVRSGDRGRMHAELRDADADIGLGLGATAPPMLRELATELLGRPPRAQDQARLRREADGLRDLLPGLSAPVLDTLLTRICRMPPERAPQRPHPADPAVAAAVLTGLFLRKLGHDLPPPTPPTPAGRPAAPGPTTPSGPGTAPERVTAPIGRLRPAGAPQAPRETHG